MENETKHAAYLSDYWTLQDDLHFSDFRHAMLSILTEAQTPLTVGVFGPWGSGKTSLLRMLKKDVEDKGLPSVRPVWFTAWKYDRHEALWRAFILRVLDSLYPREPGKGPWEDRDRIPVDELKGKQEAQVKYLDRLSRSLYGAVEWEELGKWVMEWEKAGKELAKLPAFLLLLSVGAGKVADLLGIAPDMDLVRREVQAHRMEQLTSMEQFEKTFRDAIELVLGEDGRLIVFVDDLDRCLPDKAVEILEAIKLFLEVSGTVFVLGMDREVIEKGIKARYAAFFQPQVGERPEELPIRGDIYLQKIVQIPFHLPPLAVDNLDEYILVLEQNVPADARLGETARAVFAHGLYPNPRQVKRALNIFRLLQEVALAREQRPEEEGGLPEESVAWSLLAKAVLIQTQWPELYRDWRQYPTLVQTLEAEYARRPLSEEEVLRGRVMQPPGEDREEEEQVPAGGLLAPYLRDRRKYVLLERMLAFPEEVGEGRKQARFEGLGREQMAAYVRLTGAVGPEEPVVVAPGGLLGEMLSGDRARIQEAAARLDEQEPERDGSLHQSLREELQEVMRVSTRSARERVSAGDSLALAGDPRFRPDAWYLPNDPLLGFIEVPRGRFLMGSDKDQDPHANDAEVPRHEVTLPSYYIARYPVTVAQFRAYAGDTSAGLEGRLPKGRDNHPVVEVNWDEAIGYCRWLTEKLQHWDSTPEWLKGRLWEQEWAITLPSEAEWEKAARGGLEVPEGLAGSPGGLHIAFKGENPEPRRVYPWGEKPDPENANYDETGIGTTSAVGCFLGGVSPYGVEDLTGNVWEWTRSLWGTSSGRPQFSYPYDPKDGREKLDAGQNVRRVLRGGSFNNGSKDVRCTYRISNTPDNSTEVTGFRLVVSQVYS